MGRMANYPTLLTDACLAFYPPPPYIFDHFHEQDLVIL